MSNIHFHQLHLPNLSPKNTFTFFDYISNCKNFIVMTKKCFLGTLRIYKISVNCEKCLNWSLIAPIKKYRNIPKNFQRIPVWKYKAYTVPKNTGIPGFCKNTVPYRTGIKFLIPLGPAEWSPRGDHRLMYVYWHQWSKSIYIGINAHVTEQEKIELLSQWMLDDWVLQYKYKKN